MPQAVVDSPHTRAPWSGGTSHPASCLLEYSLGAGAWSALATMVLSTQLGALLRGLIALPGE